MRSIEERRAVARRVFEALCSHYPDRYITFIERPGSEEPSSEASAQADTTAEPIGQGFREKPLKSALTPSR